MFDELIKQDRSVKRENSSQGRRDPIQQHTKCCGRNHGALVFTAGASDIGLEK